jgi:hypothetical protein
MALLRKFNVAVVAVALAAWNRPVVPKFVPVDDAAILTVL